MTRIESVNLNTHRSPLPVQLILIVHIHGSMSDLYTLSWTFMLN